MPNLKQDANGKQIAMISEPDLGFVAEHLRVESQYLDFVIDCSQTLRNLLERNSGNRVAPVVEGSPSKSVSESGAAAIEPAQIDGLIDELRLNSNIQFAVLADGRKKLQGLLWRLFGNEPNNRSLRMLIRDVDGPLKMELQSLRTEINGKLNSVRALNLGTQAVLVYTMNYYERFLSGISGTENKDDRYSSKGRVSPLTSGILRTNC